ncbi:hypothetical protein EC988_007716, partial [Linderina pennispora]
MMDTKADDNKTTLLHFVASTVEENFPDALEFLQELKPVDSGCRVSYAEMKADMGDMRHRLHDAKRELELLREQRELELKEIAIENEKSASEPKVEGSDSTPATDSGDDSSGESPNSNLTTSSASDPQDRFLLTVRRFLIEANEQFDALSSQFTAMEDAYSNSVLLYGEDPRSMTPEEFFGIFKTFTASFDQVIRDNHRERERKKAAEKRRKQIEAQIEQKRLNRQNRAALLANGASRIRVDANTEGAASSDSANDSASPAAAAAPTSSSGGAGTENGAVDDLLKSLMAGTDLESVEASKRRRRRELMSIRRRSSLRRSVHRTSISIKALQMLKDIKEEDLTGESSEPVPPLP